MAPRSILVVDDHPASLRALSRLLFRFGFRAREAATFAEARRMATEEAPDVLISDLQLPDGDGCDLVRTLLATSPQLRAIALSGYDSDADKERCRRAGFQLLLSKPVVLERLLAAVEPGPAPRMVARGHTSPAGDTAE